MRGSTARNRSAGVLLAGLLGVACAGLAGCGDASSGGTVGVAPGAGTTALKIVYDDGGGSTKTWQLTCDPAGGDHPDATAACAALAEGGKAGLAPVPAGQMCTEIYGGPQTARITGTWRGEDVDASLKRSNGCEISRWEALAGLLPSS